MQTATRTICVSTRMICRAACPLGRSVTASLVKPDPSRKHACERRGKVFLWFCFVFVTLPDQPCCSFLLQCCATRWPKRGCLWCPGPPSRSTSNRWKIMFCQELFASCYYILHAIIEFSRWTQAAPLASTPVAKWRCCSGRTGKTRRKQSNLHSRKHTQIYVQLIYPLV